MRASSESIVPVRAITGPFMVVALVLAGCSQAVPPPVDSPLLTATDLDVLRVVIEEVVRPEIESGIIATGLPGASETVVISPTRTPALWNREGLPHSMPPPSPFRTQPPPPPLPSEAVAAESLTREERDVWSIRNRHARDIPELGIADFATRRTDVMPCTTGADWNRFVRFSSPAYVTPTSAVLYVDYIGGCFGEGWLVRLTRSGGRWRVIGLQMMWIT